MPTIYYDCGRRYPSVNVKDYSRYGDVSGILADYPEDFRAFYTALTDEDRQGCYEFAVECHFEDAQSDAEDLFPAFSPKVYQAGRMGGWLIVDGLPDPEDWTEDLHEAWETFATYVKGYRDHTLPLSVELCYLNDYEHHLADLQRAEDYQRVGRWAAAFAGTPFADYPEALDTITETI